MPRAVFNIEDADDLRDVVHHAVEAISSGKLVALPVGDTLGVVASALIPAAVTQVQAIHGAGGTSPVSFAVKSLDDALDFVPGMTVMGRRIARRSWPGPVTLVVEDGHPDSVIQRLDDSVKKATMLQQRVALTCPANAITQQVLRLCAGPVVLSVVDRGLAELLPIPDQQVGELGGQVDLVLVGQVKPTDRAVSVVQVLASGEINVLQEGSVDAETVNRLANFLGLVVCTGNTCRSPMAEALFKKLVAEKVGCEIDQLVERGIQIASVGIAAMPGSPAADQATQVMRQIGLEIGDHASQPISAHSAKAADLILTMTNGHRHALVSRWPMLEPRTRTLRVDGGDIADPIGSPVNVYEACAQQIEQNLKHWIDQFDWQQFSNDG